MKTFYTLSEPTKGIKWPFVLSPFHHLRVIRGWSYWKHCIVDSGVEIFARGAKDYPISFFDRYEFKAQNLTEIYGDRIWFVIPDYPDDYRNNPIPHNVRRTLANIRRFHEVKDVNWVYPIQSDYLNLQSLHDSCHQVMKFHPERVGIGTVCKTNNIDFIEKACIMVRRHFYNAHVHAFGPTLRALPRILPHIDSWDSCAYFCSRKTHGFMCRNKKERLEYYKLYIQRIEEILKQYNSQTRLEVSH